MIIRELLASVRDTLQDTDKTYWSDSELLALVNECKRYLTADRKEETITTTVSLSDSINVYSLDNVLRFVSIKDSNNTERKLYPDDGSGDNDVGGVIVQSYDSIYVNNPEDNTSLTIKHISFPSEDNLNDTIRPGDEESYKYYVLAKAYEKDTEMQNFAKSSQFLQLFTQYIKANKKNSNLNYIHKQETTKGYYY